jgi:uncharacterized protein (UPF0261 family)
VQQGNLNASGHRPACKMDAVLGYVGFSECLHTGDFDSDECESATAKMSNVETFFADGRVDAASFVSVCGAGGTALTSGD